ncbi:MAG TPA: sialidase family protein, partial [Nitrososphaeraceae archaeon]
MLKYGARRITQFISQYRFPTLSPAIVPVILTVLAFSLFLSSLSAQDISAQNVSAQNISANNNNENQVEHDNNNTKMNKLVSSNSINSNLTNTTITSNHDSLKRQGPLAKDKFGIDMLYPSKPGGEEWFMNMADPVSDMRFNPQDKITRNSDGSWKIKSDQVRMYVSNSNGYSPNQITSDSGQSRVAARGFMGSPKDWRDIEITGYVKLNKFSENDNFVWYTRGGKHTDSDPCQGSSYKGNLFYHGETQFAKEQWHVSYAKSPTIVATNPLDGKWIGFKFAMYNFVTSDGKSGVKLENWIDSDADGKNWEKVYEGADAGKWGRTGADCEVKADQIIWWGGPLATFRWDFAPDVDFRDLSVREIVGQNGILQGVSYFTGTSTSSNVPDFGNTLRSEDGQSNPNNPLPLEAIRRQAVVGDGGTSNSINENSSNDNGGGAVSPSNGRPIGGEISHETRVVSGNMVFVTWVQGDEDNTDIYLKISQDSGVTYGSPINLSNNPASLSYSQQVVATDNNNVYIVWEDDDGNSENSDIFFISSSDGGKSFSGKVNLSNDPSGSGNPVLSVSGNNVYVAWSGISPDSTDILMAHSTNGGETFSTPINLSNDPELSYNPKLYLNGSNLHVEWTDQDDNGAVNTKKITLPNVIDATTNQNNDNFISSLNNTDFDSAEQNSTSLITTGQDNSNNTNSDTIPDSEMVNQTFTSPLTTEPTKSNSTIPNSNSNSSSDLPPSPTLNHESELHNKAAIVHNNSTEVHMEASNPEPYKVAVNDKSTLANVDSDEFKTIIAAAEEALKVKESQNTAKQADNSIGITTDFEPYVMQQVGKESANKEPQLQKQLRQEQWQPEASSNGSIEAGKDEQNAASGGGLVIQVEPNPLEGSTGKSSPDSTLQELEQQYHQQSDKQQSQSQSQVEQGEKQNPTEVITSKTEKHDPQGEIITYPSHQSPSEIKKPVNENENENE